MNTGECNCSLGCTYSLSSSADSQWGPYHCSRMASPDGGMPKVYVGWRVVSWRSWPTYCPYGLPGRRFFRQSVQRQCPPRADSSSAYACVVIRSAKTLKMARRTCRQDVPAGAIVSWCRMMLPICFTRLRYFAKTDLLVVVELFPSFFFSIFCPERVFSSSAMFLSWLFWAPGQ